MRTWHVFYRFALHDTSRSAAICRGRLCGLCLLGLIRRMHLPRSAACRGLPGSAWAPGHTQGRQRLWELPGRAILRCGCHMQG